MLAKKREADAKSDWEAKQLDKPVVLPMLAPEQWPFNGEAPTADSLVDAKQVKPLSEAVKGQRKDFEYVNALRKEMTRLVDPFRLMARHAKDTCTKQGQELAEMVQNFEKFKEMTRKQQREFVAMPILEEKVQAIRRTTASEFSRVGTLISECERKLEKLDHDVVSGK